MKLAGVTVLDFAQFMAGPMVSSILADHGARVIKVEPPAGDPTRRGPRRRPGQGEGDTFRALNRGKRSIALDLKRPGHRDAALRLIERADVVVESFRPGVAERLGIGYDAARARNPDLVYCSVSAFGQNGVLKDAAAHDTLVQALAGAFAFDAEGRPVEPAVSLAGVAAAQFAVSGILMALLAARAGQGGDHLDVAMHDAVLAVRGGAAVAALAAAAPERPVEAPGLALNASYRTADGRWLRVDARDANAATVLLEALALAELLPVGLGPPGPGQERLREALAQAFAGDSLAGWMARLGVAGGVAPVLGLAEALAHSHVASRGLVEADEQGGRHLGTPLRFVHGRARPRYRVAGLGEDAGEILREAGFGEAEIAALELDAER